MRRAVGAVAVLWLAAAPAAPADVGRTVAAGALRAAVTPDPWHLTLADGRGALLAERSETGGGAAGTLGFRTSGRWWHATRVLAERREGDAYAADLATTDPLGGRIAVRLAPDADGIVSLVAIAEPAGGAEALQTSIAFDAAAGERFLGFGERSNAVDQRGLDVESYVSDGPYQPEERAPSYLLIPSPGVRPRDDATYFPMPWLLSTRGYGVLDDDDATSAFRLATERADAWSVEVDGARLSLRFFAGPRPADVVQRLSARLGRQPPAAAPFFFGPWFQPGRGDDAVSVKRLRDADAPASVAQTYTHYLPCGDQQGAEDAQRRRTAALHDQGLAVTTYFNPMICTGYQPAFDDAVAAGVLTRNAAGQPYTYRYTGSSQFLVGQFDFSAPGATAFYGRLLAEAVAHGYDGWMEDFGEYTPTDAVSADGTPGPEMHNRYPALYHRAAWDYSRRAPRPLARFNRSGWTGAASASQIVWGGDPTTDWGFDGLTSAVRQGLSMGLSGVSLWGSDIGGYFSLGSRRLTPELLVRWIEVGAASGVMRTEANGFDLPEHGPRPQIFDDGVLPVWRRYAKLRTQLYPYLAGAEAAYDRTGMPLMRHLALAYPDDARATARDDEYLLGPDLLVAPVLAPGATERALYLPPGDWLDLWRSAAFVEADGSLSLGRARVLEGGRDVTVPAPLAELPLLVRAGAIVPTLAPDVDTLSTYGSGPGLVHLSDRAGELRLLAFPRGSSRAALGPTGSVRSAEGRRTWTLRIGASRRRLFRVQAALSALRRPFTPCRVTLGRRPLARRAWSYDRATSVLRMRFRARSARVVVRGGCR